MVGKNTLALEDLVWAKMKTYPYWPAKIIQPPASSSVKKAHHYVFFFGTKNTAWISDENIQLHSENMLESTPKKLSQSLKNAIEEIKKLAPMWQAEKDARALFEKNDKDDSESENETLLSMPPKPSPSPSRKKLKIQYARRNDGKIVKVSTKKKLRVKFPMRSPKKRRFSSDDDTDQHLISNSRIEYSYSDDDMGELYDVHNRIPPSKYVEPTSKKIGFLGLGYIGRAIVNNLLNSGHHVTLWNRTIEKCDEFIRKGAIKAATPEDVVKASDIVFSCLSDPSAVKAVVFGGTGVLKGFEGKAIGNKGGYVELTSIDDVTSEEIAEAITVCGGKYLESPMTGSRQLADAGELLMLCAGDPELFSDCSTCYHAISKNVLFVDKNVGSASKLSLIYSLLFGSTNAAIAEALALCERIDISRNDFLEIAQLKGIFSPVLLERSKAMIDRDFFPPTTPLKHQQKDMYLALGLGNEFHQMMPVARFANALYTHAKRLGYSEHDLSAVYQGVKF